MVFSKKERKKERKFILHSDGNFIGLQAGRLLSHRAQSSLEQSCYVLYRTTGKKLR